MVSENSQVWHRFKTSVFDYQKIHLALIDSIPSILPYVSGHHPFRLNRDGHNRFLTYLSTYRRQFVKVNKEQLVKINKFNLFNQNATLQNDRKAVGILSGKGWDKHLLSQREMWLCSLSNYQIVMPAGKTSQKTVKVYSPFRAKLHSSWWHIKVCTRFYFQFKIFISKTESQGLRKEH